MLESKIESLLTHKIKEVNGMFIKWDSQLIKGKPDRIILLPNGKTVFVEVKAPGEKPRKLQLAFHRKLKKLGFKIYIVDSVESVIELVEKIKKEVI